MTLLFNIIWVQNAFTTCPSKCQSPFHIAGKSPFYAIPSYSIKDAILNFKGIAKGFEDQLTLGILRLHGRITSKAMLECQPTQSGDKVGYMARTLYPLLAAVNGMIRSNDLLISFNR